MKKEIEPKDTTRAAAYALWMKAPNPMVTFFKTLDVTNLVKVSKKTHLKFNMLLDYCIGKAAAPIKEFYILPVGDKLIQYDAIAVNTIVKNKNNEVSSCDISQSADLIAFNQEYRSIPLKLPRAVRTEICPRKVWSLVHRLLLIRRLMARSA